MDESNSSPLSEVTFRESSELHAIRNHKRRCRRGQRSLTNSSHAARWTPRLRCNAYLVTSMFCARSFRERKLVREYHQDRVRRNQEYLYDEQLNEAKESRKAAVSIGRLSKLAFIFIPLSFTTSFFGMNVREFGTGHASVWVFFTAALIISALSLAPLWRSIKSTIWKYPSCRAVEITIKLVKFSPYIAFWFGWFCLFHSRCTNNLFRLSLPVGSSADGFNRFYSISRPDDFYFNPLLSMIDKGSVPWFWRRKAKMIYDFFDAPEWEENTFYHGLRSGFRKRSQF